mmetsp:Transcript_32090/g.67473  ORF Transcript_32090/g.67473 Transcript_32090/m.67473 type:complete len:150 (-) Transcript_32090:86-535(-)
MLQDGEMNLLGQMVCLVGFRSIMIHFVAGGGGILIGTLIPSSQRRWLSMICQLQKHSQRKSGICSGILITDDGWRRIDSSGRTSSSEGLHNSCGSMNVEGRLPDSATVETAWNNFSSDNPEFHQQQCYTTKCHEGNEQSGSNRPKRIKV